MEYTIKHCPHCDGELHIPINLKTCICMFCGESFTLQETAVSDIPEKEPQSIKVDYKKALESIAGLIENVELQLTKFKKESYNSSFDNYVQNSIPILQPVEYYATFLNGNLESAVEETTQTLMKVIENDIAGKKSGRVNSSKNSMIDQYRFFLTVYTVPMIRHLNYSISEPLADCIIENWRKRYPEFAFNKGSYENLQAGFEHKGFCFITTAVCESMNKPDNCYELTAFRRFRDTYMQETKERQALVEDYYQIAPAIVASINIRIDYQDKYKEIWLQYLQPCLVDIEENRLKECEICYSKMVHNLKEEYII